jgi:hypothetical protein
MVIHFNGKEHDNRHFWTGVSKHEAIIAVTDVNLKIGDKTSSKDIAWKTRA